MKLLPKNVEPFIFPPITVPPEEAVSDKLLDAIRDCNGMIYLEGGVSAESFWVALERDYALRLGKSVFAFNSLTKKLVRDPSEPLALRVFISSSHHDRVAVQHILDIMRKRDFDPWFDEWNVRPGDEFQNEIFHGIERALAAGGYVVAFWSNRAHSSRWVELEHQQSEIMQPQRVLYAVLDETPLPLPTWQGGVVQLYGDAERSQMHRIDDLIVRLYWLIYRNTHQNQLS